MCPLLMNPSQEGMAGFDLAQRTARLCMMGTLACAGGRLQVALERKKRQATLLMFEIMAATS